MNAAFRRTLLIVVIAIALLLAPLVGSLMFTVNEREVALVLQFGNPVRSCTEPGLYFKVPLIQEVQRLPKNLQFWASTPEERVVDLPTADGKKVEVSGWAVWRITDPVKFVKTLRTVDNAQLRVGTFVRSATRDVITAYPLTEVVRSTERKLTYSFQIEPIEIGRSSDAPAPGALRGSSDAVQERIRMGREKIVEKIVEKIKLMLHDRKAESGEALQGERGIELVDMGITRIEFVAQVREAAFSRLIAFMESIASRQVSEGEQRKQEILNRTEAEVQRLLGEGTEEGNTIRGNVDAEVIEKYAQAITEAGDFYTFIRTLEAYEGIFGGDTRLILSTDTDLLRLLKSGLQPSR